DGIYLDTHRRKGGELALGVADLVRAPKKRALCAPQGGEKRLPTWRAAPSAADSENRLVDCTGSRRNCLRRELVAGELGELSHPRRYIVEEFGARLRRHVPAAQGGRIVHVAVTREECRALEAANSATGAK